ncbi:hypothetical protein FACS189465_0470 [Clostridia bacterium]|nr:hypothetical protein FACS189465_0470 [Clostridia bacterium]
MQENNRTEFKRELNERITLQTMLSPRQNLTFRQLYIYYEEKNFEPTEQFIENLDLRQGNGKFNYVAYLLADENGVSIKVTVYAGTDKVDLLETREYGNRCIKLLGFYVTKEHEKMGIG